MAADHTDEEVSSPSDEDVSREAWLALAVATLASFLVVLDVSVVNVAFPSIATDLGATRSELSWVVSGYNITIASLLLLAGRLADRSGRRLVFMIGLAVFLVGSAASGLASNPEQLIAARVVQATGGATLTPASLAMALPAFPLARRSVAIGIWGAMGALGAAFGPSIGALLIDLVNWRMIFLINVPLGIVVLFLTPRFASESRDESATGRFDLVGVPLGVVGVFLVMLGIVRSETEGWGHPSVVGLIVVGLAFVPVVVARSSRHPAPLLDLGLFRIRTFSVSIGAFWVYSLGFTGGFLVNSILLQQFWGMSVLQAGFGLTPGPLTATVTSVVSGDLADRIGHRWLVGLGSVIAAMSYALLALGAGEEQQYFALFLPHSLLLGLGVGTTIAGFQSAALGEVLPHQFASGNATMRTLQQVGYAIGISVVITLLGATLDVDAFRNAYSWVAACFAIAGVLVIALYPAGSASDRVADGVR